MSAKKTCLVKLKKEMVSFIREPPPHIPAVAINESNILEWHYLIEGPPETPYEGGWYIGKLKFPPDYPFKPPAIMMVTPSGRFKTGTRLCLSMSDFHPETWNPMWSVASVLTGLLSFMLEDTPTTGSVETTVGEKKKIAAESGDKLLQHPQYRALFPQLPDLIQQQKVRTAQSQAQGSEDQREANGVAEPTGEEGPEKPREEGEEVGEGARGEGGEAMGREVQEAARDQAREEATYEVGEEVGRQVGRGVEEEARGEMGREAGRGAQEGVQAASGEANGERKEGRSGEHGKAEGETRLGVQCRGEDRQVGERNAEAGGYSGEVASGSDVEAALREALSGEGASGDDAAGGDSKEGPVTSGAAHSEADISVSAADIGILAATHGPYREAAEAATRRDFEGALRKCQVALSEEGALPPLDGCQLAVTCCVQLGRFEEAEGVLRKAGQAQGSGRAAPAATTPAFQNGLARLARQVGIVEARVEEAHWLLRGSGAEAAGDEEGASGADPEGALEVLDSLLQQHCTRAPHVLMLKARTLLVLGDMEGAVQAMEAALHLCSASDPLQDEADEGVGQSEASTFVLPLVTSHEVLDALSRARTAIRHKTRGNEQYRKRNYVAALKAYDNALAAEDSCAAVHCNRAAALAALNRHEEALGACERALQAYNGYTKARRRRGDCLASLGRHGEALAEYMHLLDRSPLDSALQRLVDKEQQLVNS